MPEGFAFCGRCGVALPAAPGLEERRVVTVLFCDLAGFTARSDRADPEDVRALLRPFHARLRREIERFGGTLDKFTGDGAMAVFGAPVAHEDDPERAVRCGLAIQKAVADLNRARVDLSLQVRIGINTGEAAIAFDRRETETVVGDVVNIASRLEGVAPVGRMLVGEPTFRATRRIFDYEPLPPVRVKGKAEPLRAWLAVSARSRVSGVGDQVRPSAFLGRATELERLRAAYAKTREAASVQLVTIVGEPGVGKSRLVRELHAFVDAQPELITWGQGHCLPYGEGISFWALAEIIKAHAGILEFDDPPTAAGKLADAVAAVVGDEAECHWLQARLAPLLGLAGAVGATRDEAFTAWRRFLEAAAARRPMVVVLEDLHWADDAMLAFIRHLVAESGGVPLFVVATARLELYDHAPDWASLGEGSTTIRLAPLSDTDTTRLITSLLGYGVLAAEVRAQLLAQVGGNPLYAEQVCRMLEEQDLLQRDGGTLRPRPDAPTDLFPDSIQALIAARLDTLPPERKALLQDAAVVGTVFWPGALAAIGGRDPAAIRADLEDLAGRAFIRTAQESSVAGEPEYAFWHAFTREVAYGQLPRAARIHKHRAVAGWVEQVAGERVASASASTGLTGSASHGPPAHSAGGHAELLTHHYLTALELAGTARAADEVAELQGPALRSLLLAGDQAMHLDVARAHLHYQRALGLLPDDDPGRATVLARAAEAARLMLRTDQAEQLFGEAIAAFQERGDRLGAGDAMVRRANLHWHQGETSQARAAFAAAIELLEQEPPSRELASAYLERGKDIHTSGRPAEALAWLERAIGLADRLGAEEIRQQSLMYQGCARGEIGDPGGLADVWESLALALRMGLGRETALAYANLSSELFEFEGPGAALRTAQDGSAFCRLRGIAESERWLLAATVEILTDLGRWDEAVGLTDQLLAARADITDSYDSVMLIPRKAYILLHRGAVDEAAEHKDWFVARGRHIGDLQALSQVLPIAALVEQARGDVPSAVRLVQELEQATRNGPACYRGPLPDVVRVCQAAGELGLIERFLEGADSPAARSQHCVVTARAALAEARGRLEEAAGLYADARDRWSDFGVVLEHGQALLGLGRCATGLGQPRARDHLLDAARVFTGLGAQPLLTETDRCLAQVSAQTP